MSSTIVTYSFSNLIGTPFRSSPVHGHALINDKIESPHRLFHWSQAVGAMGIDDINIFQPEAIQRRLQSFNDVLPGQSMIIDEIFTVDSAPVDLCRNGKTNYFPCASALENSLVLMTMSLRFQPKCLMALPITISDSPFV